MKLRKQRGPVMPKEATKMRILSEGARIVYEKGFNHTGIQEILEAAGVPKGSFYFYFKSKDDFGLQLVDFYLEFALAGMDAVLGLSSHEPLERLRNFFRHMKGVAEERGLRGGCPIGNLAQEMADQSEAFRLKVNHAFSALSGRIARCLEEAQRLNQIGPSTDPGELADFIMNSWEGALLRMKAENSLLPLDVFERMIFEGLLRL
jgi:TetR/AcrR family transcriptional regulator, transcriptional repressor for nem operon